MTRRPRSTAFALLLVAPLVLAGCSVGGSDPEADVSASTAAGARIKGAEIEELAVAEFEGKVPEGARVECPDVAGEKGATARCTWTFTDSSTLGMTVTITSFTTSTGRFRAAFANDAKVTPAP